MFKLTKWGKSSFIGGVPGGVSGREEVGEYESKEEAETHLPKGFIFTEDEKLSETLPRWSISDDLYTWVYIKQNQE